MAELPRRSAPSLPPLRDVIARYDIAAQRRLGQHFLLDLNLTARIARAAGPLDGRNVIEIGAGPGGLTRALLESGAERVVAIEPDPRCVAALGELREAYGERLQVIEADALELDCATLAPPPRRIVSNLPYNVAVPLVIGWLRDAEAFESLTLMFQKEVAARLAAEPGTAAYGRLSIIAQWRTTVRREFDIDARAFTPPPKVVSSVVTLVPRRPPPPADWRAVETVTARAFGQRRKMLRTSLKSLGLDLERLGIAPTGRAEELGVDDFLTLARALPAAAIGAVSAPRRRR